MRILLAFALALALASSARAEVKYLTDEAGRWSQWEFSADGSSRASYAAAKADVAAFEGRLVALDAIIRRAPAVARPVGFMARSWGHLDSYAKVGPEQPKGLSLPLGGSVTFGAFAILEYQRGGKTVRDVGGETQLLDLAVNSLQPAFLGARRTPYEWNGVDTDAFLQPASSGAVAGFPRFEDLIVIKKRPEPIWVPVSMEAALRLVSTARKNDVVPLKEHLAAAKPGQRVESSTRELQRLEGEIASIEAFIASLAPKDRAAAACYDSQGDSWRTHFRASPSTGCVPLVRPNWAFFDRRLPRSAPQVLIVSQVARCFPEKPSSMTAGCPVNLRLLETVDRRALIDWLQ